MVSAPGLTEVKATREQIYKRCREFIGDDSIDVKMGSTSHWAINEQYAEQISKGNV